MARLTVAEARHVKLTEYKTETGVPLTETERNFLWDVVRGLRIAPSRTAPDCYDLSPESWVGIVAIGGLTVEISPKVSISRVVRMLSHSLDKVRWNEGATVSRDSTLSEAVAEVLVWHVERIVQWGLLHGYRSTDEALFSVRGRVRHEDQIRCRLGQLMPIEVRYDDFTVDILENQILNSALWAISALPIQGAGLLTRLRRARHFFSDIGFLTLGSKVVPRVHYSRLNEHYRPALEWARLVLESGTFESRFGFVAGRALLFDMNLVFERFVRAAIREQLDLSPEEFPIGKNCPLHHLDRGRRIRLEPDLSWWQSDLCLFVGDAKYKWLDADERAKNADLFQLHAYLVGFGVPQGLLIYASEANDLVHHDVTRLDHRLSVVGIRLDGDWSTVEDQCRRIAASIREIAARAKAMATAEVRYSASTH